MSTRKHFPFCSCSGRSLRRLMRAAMTTALVATGVVALGQQPAAAAVQYTFYASPTGSGTTCSLAAPCSLTGARDKVRTVNAAMTGDIVVNLRGGTYALTSTFALTANGIHTCPARAMIPHPTNPATAHSRKNPSRFPVRSERRPTRNPAIGATRLVR